MISQASYQFNNKLVASHNIMTSGPKIVHIETRYVETDAINFRDVVQRLTGKNSSTTNWVGNGASISFVAGSSDYNERGITENDGVSAKPQEDTTVKNNSVASSSMLLMNVSFKDFEGLLSDLPSVEELLML